LAEDYDNLQNRPSILRDAARLRESVDALVVAVQTRDRAWAARYQLSASQLHGLLSLQREGPLTVTHLGEALGIEKSTASRLAKGLLSLGLVRKRPSNLDERRVILQITEKGMRMSRRILNDLSGEYIGAVSRQSPEIRDQLPGILDQLAKELWPEPVARERTDSSAPVTPRSGPVKEPRDEEPTP
jgi:DNA-binding MarR family transcriptional regulator